MENFIAQYSEQGSHKHQAEVDCHKAFMDAMEEAFNDCEFYTEILNMSCLPIKQAVHKISHTVQHSVVSQLLN